MMPRPLLAARDTNEPLSAGALFGENRSLVLEQSGFCSSGEAAATRQDVIQRILEKRALPLKPIGWRGFLWIGLAVNPEHLLFG